jgi:hypothetical protein
MRSPICEGPTHFGPFFALGVLCEVTPKAMCFTQIALWCPSFSFPHTSLSRRGVPDALEAL